MARKIDEAKRLEIGRAALVVLKQRGVHGTTMSDIARELGMKRPTLYWYFSDVPSIFEQVHARSLNDAAAFVAARVAGIEDPLDLLMAVVQGQNDYFAQEGLEDYVALLTQFWGAGGPEARERFRAVIMRQLGPTRDLLVAVIERGIAAGQVKPCDAAALVDTMFAFMDGVVVHGVLRGTDPETLYPFVRQHLIDPLRTSEEL